jgi:FMN-dependent NADH-azoreductase
MTKEFKEREFRKISNDVSQIAREISETNKYICSVTFFGDFTKLTIQNNFDYLCVADVTFHKEKYGTIGEFEKFVKVLETLPQIKLGKRLERIILSYKDCNKDGLYFDI